MGVINYTQVRKCHINHAIKPHIDWATYATIVVAKWALFSIPTPCFIVILKKIKLLIKFINSDTTKALYSLKSIQPNIKCLI